MDQLAGAIGRQDILSEIVEGRLVTKCKDPQDHARGCSFDLTVGTLFWEGKSERVQIFV